MVQATIEVALLEENSARCMPPLSEREVLAIARSVARYPAAQSPEVVAPTAPVEGEKDRPRTPWEAAESMPSFLSQEGGQIEFLEPRLIAKGCITEIFAPRGLGKSLIVDHLAVKLAQAGRRVLVLDRDNPRGVVRERLENFGATADLLNLRVLSREKCPPLTNAGAWASFPYQEYDLVIVDSLDASTEGIGEQDSSKPSRAISPLLDVAHREAGPAVFVLGNTIKTGAHSRGSGVIEDRADIVFEVRDATSFQPSGSCPWWEELPPADAGSWARKATRRQQRTTYRLAFIPTKFRIDEEPEPFVLQIDLATKPWRVSDVTNVVDREGAEARLAKEHKRQEIEDRATETLVTEITARAARGDSPLLKDRDAVPLLQGCGLIQKAARGILKARDGMNWRLAPIPGAKGNPVGVLPLSFGPEEGIKSESDNGNTPPAKFCKSANLEGPHFRHPPFMHPMEMPPSESRINSRLQEPPISVVGSTLMAPDEQNKPKSQEREMRAVFDPKVPTEGEL